MKNILKVVEYMFVMLFAVCVTTLVCTLSYLENDSWEEDQD